MWGRGEAEPAKKNCLEAASSRGRCLEDYIPALMAKLRWPVAVRTPDTRDQQSPRRRCVGEQSPNPRWSAFTIGYVYSRRLRRSAARICISTECTVLVIDALRRSSFLLYVITEVYSSFAHSFVRSSFLSFLLYLFIYLFIIKFFIIYSLVRSFVRLFLVSFFVCLFLSSYYAPTPRFGGIKRWCASDVCLSVAYIGPKSRTARSIGRLKLAQR